MCHGPPHAYEAWGGVPVCVGPGSFVQANYGAFASCVGAMRAAVPDGARHVVEMHAGECLCVCVCVCVFSMHGYACL